MPVDRGKIVERYLLDLKRVLEGMAVDLSVTLSRIVDVIEEARRNDRTLFVMGSGTSAATASHLAADLNRHTITEGEARYRAVGLTDNAATILAVTEEAGSDKVFVEQLRNQARPADVLIGLSPTGDTPACVKAHAWATDRGLTNVAFTVGGAEKTRELAGDLAVVIPTGERFLAEDAQLVLHHLLVSLLKAELSERHGHLADTGFVPRP